MALRATPQGGTHTHTRIVTVSHTGCVCVDFLIARARARENQGDLHRLGLGRKVFLKKTRKHY